jgi:amino acid transporter
MPRAKIKSSDVIELALTILIAVSLVPVFNWLAVILAETAFTAAIYLMALGLLVWFFTKRAGETKISLVLILATIFVVSAIVQVLGTYIIFFNFPLALEWTTFAELLVVVFIADVVAEWINYTFIEHKGRR